MRREFYLGVLAIVGVIAGLAQVWPPAWFAMIFFGDEFGKIKALREIFSDFSELKGSRTSSIVFWAMKECSKSKPSFQLIERFCKR